MPKVVVQTIVRETMDAPAAVKNGRHRAASHNNIGNSSAAGTTVFQGSWGSEIIIPVKKVSAASAVTPSMTSLRGDGLRTMETNPINSGANVTMASVLEVNQ